MSIKNILLDLAFWTLSGFCFIYVLRCGIFIQLLKTEENRYLLDIEGAENNTAIIFSPYGLWHPLVFTLVMMGVISLITYFKPNSRFFKKSLWVFATSAALLGISTAIGEMVAK